MPVRTPQSVSSHIRDLCHELNPAAQPVFVGIHPEPMCEPNDCFECVRRRIESQGGRMQVGWAIWEWPHVLIEAEHHAVYESPDDHRFVDISPPATPEITRRLFLPDDAATYDFEHEGVRRDNVRRALVEDSLVREFIQAAEERNAILNSVPGVGVVSLTGETAKRYQSNIHRATLIEMQLLMRFTPQGAPCFCGSGVKFKRCHGQVRLPE